MWIFHYTCNKSYLQRAKILIFHYNYVEQKAQKPIIGHKPIRKENVPWLPWLPWLPFDMSAFIRVIQVTSREQKDKDQYFIIRRAKRRSRSVKMLIFHYTCRRTKIKIFN